MPRYVFALVALIGLIACDPVGEIVAPKGGIWGRSAGGTGDDYAAAVAVGPDQAVYVTGRLDGTVTFGAGRLDETILTAAGIRDAFVARYDRHGMLDWAVTAGGDDDDSGRGIAVAGDGGVLVTGSFIGEATFGAGEAGETILSGANGNEIFVARYDPDGTLDWVRAVTGTDHDWGYDIAAMPDGGAVITGQFEWDATFGAGDAGETTLNAYLGKDIYLARFHPDGSLAWARRAGGEGDNTGHAVAVAPDGGVLVTGEFRQSALFGEGDPAETTLVATSASDVFLAKYAADGSLEWVRKAGSATALDEADDVGWDVSAGSDGAIFVTGEFGETAIFGEGEPNQTELTATGLGNLFLARFSADGNLDWVRRSSGSFSDVGTGVAATEEGGAVVTGRFHGSTSFADGKADGVELDLDAIGLFDIMVAEFDSSGELLYAQRAGGYTGEDAGNGIAMADDGGILIAGAFGERAVFDSEDEGATTLQSKGMRDAFVAKLRPPAEDEND